MCGVIGIFGHPEAANLAYLGLYALQHRGQESAGIVATDGDKLRSVREMGHVNDIFTADRLKELPGHAAIGHVRYSTAGDSSKRNAQPIAVDYAGGSVAVGHNGNLVNAVELRERLEAEGAIFRPPPTPRSIVHLIARSRERTLPERIADALRQVRGAYSLVFLTEDSRGRRARSDGLPPAGARQDQGRTWVVSSETCAFELLGRRVRARRRAGRDGDHRSQRRSAAMRPFGTRAEPPLRLRVGLLRAPRLEHRRPVGLPRARADGAPAGRSSTRSPADVVIPVPDSGVAAAIGYARESGIPYDQGLMRSHYMGRTFIEPSQQIRHFGVKLKLSPVREVLAGKRVVVVDDSIVRGTTSQQDRRDDPRRRRERGPHAHQLAADDRPLPLRHRHARPARSSSPRRTRRRRSATFVGADSLGYLSLEGLFASVNGVREEGQGGFCDACFSNNQPINIQQPARLRQLRLISA